MRLDCPLGHLMKCRSLGVSDDNRTDASIDGTIDHLSDWLDQLVPEADVAAKQDIDVLEILFADLFESLDPGRGGHTIESRNGLKVGKYGWIRIH